MNVGELRKALEGIPDDMPVAIHCGMTCNFEYFRGVGVYKETLIEDGRFSGQWRDTTTGGECHFILSADEL